MGCAYTHSGRQEDFGVGTMWSQPPIWVGPGVRSLPSRASRQAERGFVDIEVERVRRNRAGGGTIGIDDIDTTPHTVFQKVMRTG